MDEHDQQTGQRRSGWNADATADYPIGPDDAGNAAMHAIGFVVTGWRWLVGKITSRSSIDANGSLGTARHTGSRRW